MPSGENAFSSASRCALTDGTITPISSGSMPARINASTSAATSSATRLRPAPSRYTTDPSSGGGGGAGASVNNVRSRCASTGESKCAAGGSSITSGEALLRASTSGETAAYAGRPTS